MSGTVSLLGCFRVGTVEEPRANPIPVLDPVIIGGYVSFIINQASESKRNVNKCIAS